MALAASLLSRGRLAARGLVAPAHARALSVGVPVGVPTTRMNLFTALNDAMRIACETDDSTCIFGEDVGFGGVFRCTVDLQEQFGKERIFNTPLSEQVACFRKSFSSSRLLISPRRRRMFASYLGCTIQSHQRSLYLA